MLAAEAPDYSSKKLPDRARAIADRLGNNQT
jgi:hypothetical protein